MGDYRSRHFYGHNDPGSGIYYFQYVSSNNFQGPGGQVKDVVAWLNAAPNASGKPYNGLGPGFYFFDSANGKNPQFNKGGTLTPDVTLNSGSIPDPKFQMRGYIYLNAANFGSKGSGIGVHQSETPPPRCAKLPVGLIGTTKGISSRATRCGSLQLPIVLKPQPCSRAITLRSHAST